MKLAENICLIGIVMRVRYVSSAGHELAADYVVAHVDLPGLGGSFVTHQQVSESLLLLSS